MTEKEENGLIGCLLSVGALGFIGALVIGSLLNGFVTMQLWNWLLAPVFPLLPELNLVYAIGVSFVVSHMTKANVPTKEIENWSDAISGLLVAWLTPFLVLFIGYVIAQFYPG